jgi:hypothetical protein
MVITYILHDISKKIRSIKPYYMVLHVPAFITWTLHVHLHVLLQIILHVILHLNYMVITYILHDISKKIRSIKPGPPLPPPPHARLPPTPPPLTRSPLRQRARSPIPPPLVRPRGVGQAVGRAVALPPQPVLGGLSLQLSKRTSARFGQSALCTGHSLNRHAWQ